MTEENNKPFRQTKKLVRLALDDGWTQKEIAAKARVQQSVVSGWATGKNKAKRHQIEFLLEEYGRQLRKLSSSVYCTQNYYYELTSELLSLFKSSGIDTHQLEEKSSIALADARKLLRGKCTQAQLQQLNEFEQLSDEIITQVEAPVIFKFVFQNQISSGKCKKKVSIGRWVIHSLGGTKFILAIQSRRMLSNTQFKAERKRKEKLGYESWSEGEAAFDDYFINTCNDDSCRWNTALLEIDSVEKMILKAEQILKPSEFSKVYSYQDLVTLTFLLKKALLEAGFAVKGVRKITAY